MRLAIASVLVGLGISAIPIATAAPGPPICDGPNGNTTRTWCVYKNPDNDKEYCCVDWQRWPNDKAVTPTKETEASTAESPEPTRNNDR